MGGGSTIQLLGLYKSLRAGMSTWEKVREEGEEEHKPDCTLVVKELIRRFMVTTLCS